MTRRSAARRYCGMCDKWVPAGERECKVCGAATDRPEQSAPRVVDLMDALRRALPREHVPCPECAAGNTPHALSHEGKP